jgi:cellulose synthase/poly-beta-1,6-N-acetylglucosamine synthase-like glycosyltransferase
LVVFFPPDCGEKRKYQMIAENLDFAKSLNYWELHFFILILFTIIYSFGMTFLKNGLSKKYSVSSSPPAFVSIIVCMHNEEKNISACLDKLIQQDYPQEALEIIVVNDRSTDNTGTILNTYCQKFLQISQITITETKEGFAPKKFAIDQAITATQGEIILLTDADGRPGPMWIKQMTSYFSDDVGMAIGYAPYETGSKSGSFWSRLLCFEYFSQAAVAAATCGIGYPITCVGTNMAYRKRVYEKLEGFGIYKSLHTGDDDLFLQRVREETDWKIAYATGTDSHVYNEPPRTWGKFYQQRIRYASKGFKYPFKVTFILILFYFLNLMLLISPLSFFDCTHCLLPFIAALFLKAATDFNFLNLASSSLEDKRYLAFFPVAFILHIPYVVIFGLLAQVINYKWADHSS